MTGETLRTDPDTGRGDRTKVSVFGPVMVSARGGSLSGHALGGRRARLALVALALTAGTGPLSAERLAEIIWPDQPPPTWPAALRGVIRALRGALSAIGGGGERVIATTPAGYALIEAVEVDLLQATVVLRAAGALADQGRHEAALSLVEPVTLFAGDQLLPGEDAGWLNGYRSQADGVSLLALELIAKSAGAIGDHHRAAEAGRRAVAGSPLDERAHRMLISALHHSGDRAGVVLAYEACRQVLADQLGVDPAPETVEVYLSAIGPAAVQGRRGCRLDRPRSSAAKPRPPGWRRRSTNQGW